MLCVNFPATLTREGADIKITYEPSELGETIVTLEADSHIAIGALSAHVEGAPLALRTSHTAGRVDVNLGWLDVPVVLTARVTLALPVASVMSSLRVSAGSECEEVKIPLQAAPAFLAVRSRLQLSQSSVSPGQTLSLHAQTTNDGSARAESVLLYIRIPGLVTFDAGEGSWIEVEPDGARAMVLPLGTVEVGERLQRKISVRLGALGVDGSLLRFEGWLVVNKQRFDLQAAEIEVRSTARARAYISLIEPRSYRYGERILALIGLASEGTELVRGARVELTSDGILWAGLHGNVVEFGTIPPFSQMVRLVEGEIVATPCGETQVTLVASVQAESGDLADAKTEITISGTPRIEVSLAIEKADANSSHGVRVVLANCGDGTAKSLAITAELPSGVVGVVDSLAIDGQSRYTLEGALPVLSREELGPLGIASAREVTWRVRSAIARQNVPVRVMLEVDGLHEEIVVLADFVAGERGESVLPQAARARARWPHTIAALRSCEDQIEATRAEHQPVFESPPCAEPLAPPAMPQPAPANRVRYELSDETGSAWRAWFPEGHVRAELGRYVLAARSFVPVGSSVPAADAALSGIRAEAGTVAAARLEAFTQSGVFGASGFDFATSLLRKSIRSYYAAMDEEAGDLEGVGLDRALVRMIGAVGIPHAQLIEEFREVLLSALETRRGTVTYAEDAPLDVVEAAERVFAMLAPVGIA